MGDGDRQGATAAAATSAVAPARQCGTCTMCCKLIEISEINKPQNVWCAQCRPGKGCGIYATRPGECRQFHCGWLVDRSLADEWRPDRAKFVITQEPGTRRIFIVCDTSAPGGWRREPFYSAIKSSLTRPGTERQQIVVMTGRKVTLLVRQGEFDLGEWKKGDQLVINYDQKDLVVKVALVPATPDRVDAVG